MHAHDRPAQQIQRSDGNPPPRLPPRATAVPAPGEQRAGVLQLPAGPQTRRTGGGRVRRSACATARVLLVVNDVLYRCGLHAILKSQPDLEVIGEAHDCDGAAERLRHVDASVVLLDPRGLSTGPLAAIRALSCRPLLVLASPGGEPVDEATALRAGANGLLLNTADPGELAAALRVVGAGYTLHLRPSAGRTAGEEDNHETPPEEVPRELMNLTPREQQVFRLIASGFGNAEIAGMLMLGESTIKSHVQHLLTKLNIPNRVHAVIYAYQHGLVKGMRAVSPRPDPAAPSPKRGWPLPAAELDIRLQSQIRQANEPRIGEFSSERPLSPSRRSSMRRKTHSSPAT